MTVIKGVNISAIAYSTITVHIPSYEHSLVILEEENVGTERQRQSDLDISLIKNAKVKKTISYSLRKRFRRRLYYTNNLILPNVNILQCQSCSCISLILRSHKPTPRNSRQGIMPETGEMSICLPVSIKICLSYIKLLIVVSSIACIHTPGHIDFVRRKSSVYITVHEMQHTNAITQKVTLS